MKSSLFLVSFFVCALSGAKDLETQPKEVSAGEQAFASACELYLQHVSNGLDLGVKVLPERLKTEKLVTAKQFKIMNELPAIVGNQVLASEPGAPEFAELFRRSGLSFDDFQAMVSSILARHYLKTHGGILFKGRRLLNQLDPDYVEESDEESSEEEETPADLSLTQYLSPRKASRPRPSTKTKPIPPPADVSEATDRLVDYLRAHNGRLPLESEYRRLFNFNYKNFIGIRQGARGALPLHASRSEAFLKVWERNEQRNREAGAPQIRFFISQIKWEWPFDERVLRILEHEATLDYPEELRPVLEKIDELVRARDVAEAQTRVLEDYLKVVVKRERILLPNDAGFAKEYLAPFEGNEEKFFLLLQIRMKELSQGKDQRKISSALAKRLFQQLYQRVRRQAKLTETT